MKDLVTPILALTIGFGVGYVNGCTASMRSMERLAVAHGAGEYVEAGERHKFAAFQWIDSASAPWAPEPCGPTARVPCPPAPVASLDPEPVAE